MTIRRHPAGPRPAMPATTTASNVVIVDDEAANVALLKRLLDATAIVRVRGFTDSRRALAHCAGAPPDLILLDLHMPGLDGFAFMEALKGLVPGDRFLPVLVLTADATAQVRERALSAGAKDFLTKPFDRTEVLLRVSNLLETRALAGLLEQQNAELKAALDIRIDVEQKAATEMRLREERIHEAFAPGALAMVFQVIADLTTGAVVGAEALARFACEPRRRPDEWFAEAGVVGRATDLELAAIEAALRQIDCLPSGAFMSVNASPMTAVAPELEVLLAGHPADRVVLELTEQARVDDYDALLSALGRLRRHGVRIAVDDTGAGYAGFQHLLRLRPDILKLDTMLTRGIDDDPVRRSLAAALVTFATEIGGVIVAEGIEIPEELSTLRRIGIPWGQGYHLARPGPPPIPSLTLP